MDPSAFLKTVVDPTLKWLPTIGVRLPINDEARTMPMAIAGQESNWTARRQDGGPARGRWQFELGGGVAEVIQKCPSQLGLVCAALDIPFDNRVIFEAMAWNDQLACSMARFLLWQDPRPLPTNEDDGWEYYIRNWRPGAPHRSLWTGVYATSLNLVKANPL